MNYIRTKDRITTSYKVTHELIEDICDAGYLKTLKKGAYVRIGKKWLNFYGEWVDIIDENDCHYSIRPNEVERVVKELPQANTIEELCDEFVIVNNADKKPFRINCDTFYKDFKATGYTCLDYAIERFNKLKEFVGSAKKHCKEVDYLYKDNPNYKFDGCIKAAVWTDKGLIYVAKMKGILPNDEIDWELL